MNPWIDYTNKDYDSLVTAMKGLARERLPAWTDHSANDFGVMLIELFAYMGDILAYYQDRVANESFLSTARERRSVLYLLRLIGYELLPAVSSSAELTLIFEMPEIIEPEDGIVTIEPGAQFATKKRGTTEAVTFEYIGTGPVTIDLKALPPVSASDDRVVYSGLPIRHSESRSDSPLESSTGEPNQSLPLSSGPLILESLDVFVEEGEDFVRWERRDNLLYHVTGTGEIEVSGVSDRHYYVQFDENDTASVIFGDGVYGRIPPAGTDNIRATYRTGGGAIGNVPARSITEIRSDIEHLDEVSNPFPAVGGADRESIDHARRFGPRTFRSGNRAVTLNDFIALAHGFGGVAKAWADSQGWNTVKLYIAPETDPSLPVPPDLKPSDNLRSRLVTYFQDRKMVGTDVRVEGPNIVPIHLSVEATAHFNFFRSDVEREIRHAINSLLAFGQVDFAANVYLSKVYEALEAIPGVKFANVTHFSRQSARAAGRRPQIESDGRIEMRPSEIPTLGTLDLDLSGGIEPGEA
jgi:uncharacterized phage protein gp47/JayE